MKGIVAKISIEDESAILIDINKKQYSFFLTDCVGFESYPNVGDEVKFGLNGDEVFFVEPLSVKTVQKSVKEKVQTTHNISNKKIQNHIPLEKSVEDCLDNYFETITSDVYKYEAEFDESETLDFNMMKRFLNTAYNNLKDMDSTFMDEYLLELRRDLKSLESIYNKFHKKNKLPELAYDSIFLEQQKTYSSYKKRLDTNTSEMYTLKSSIKGLESQIKLIEDGIKNSLSIKQSESKMGDLKRYKSYYVDTIHKLASLRDENIQLKEALDVFGVKYKDKFISIYIEDAKKYDVFLKEQLNGYAYEFDKKMWESAEISPSIRAFFKRSNIEEEYSSKTFLKYFIKTLDSTKFSQEHKKLNALLEYLNDCAKIRILIVSEDIYQADHVKHLIRSLDKDYSVEESDKPRSTYYRKDLKKIDIIFVDFNIKNPLIIEYIQMIQKRLEQSNSSAILCIIANNFTKDTITLLKQNRIHHFLSTELNDEEFQLHLKEIIESIDE